MNEFEKASDAIEKDRDYINTDIILFVLQKKDIKKEEIGSKIID